MAGRKAGHFFALLPVLLRGSLRWDRTARWSDRPQFPSSRAARSAHF